MTAVTVKWRDGTSRSVPAEVVYDAVMEIEAKRGVCPPAALVDAARKVSSPLHPLFNWDNDDAAERYREWQARCAMNTLEIVVAERQPAPAFVSVTLVTGERGYRPTVALPLDQGDQVLAECRAQLNALRRRYGHLEQFADIWAAIEAA